LIGDVAFGAWTRLPLITVALLVFTLVLADFFDAMGTMTGLGKEAGLLDKDGMLPNVGRALFVEGLAGAAGGYARRVRTRSSSSRLPESRRGPGPGWPT
jgi:AGZA family xanthine/uracil permease-like MFS transporter